MKGNEGLFNCLTSHPMKMIYLFPFLCLFVLPRGIPRLDNVHVKRGWIEKKEGKERTPLLFLFFLVVVNFSLSRLPSFF